HPWFGSGNTCHLVQGHLGTVTVHGHPVQNRRIGPAGPDRRKIPFGHFNYFLHLLVSLFPNFFNGFHSQSSPLTKVPIFSPITILLIFPTSFRLKTIIGILLSMHKEVAVESITRKRLFKISIKLRSSNFLASGFKTGSCS